MNKIAMAAFFDELQKIADFSLIGKEISHAPVGRILHRGAGELTGTIGNLGEHMRGLQAGHAAQAAAEEARHAHLESMLQSGAVNPAKHDMKEFMRSGKVIPKSPEPTVVAPKAETKTTVLPKPAAPAVGPEGTAILPAGAPAKPLPQGAIKQPPAAPAGPAQTAPAQRPPIQGPPPKAPPKRRPLSTGQAMGAGGLASMGLMGAGYEMGHQSQPQAQPSQR
jgi:hypothetical protein